MENYNHNCLVFATHKLDEGILDYLACLLYTSDAADE